MFFLLIVHWSLFLPGILLLWFPANALLSSKVQLRTFDSFNNLDSSQRYRAWWWVPVLWLDPWRGWGGAWLVKEALSLESSRWAYVPKSDYAVLCGVLLLGVLAQLFTRREEGVLLAPMGFVLGVVTAVMPWPVALATAVGAVLGLFAFRNFQMFFLGAGLAVGLLSFALRADLLWIVPMAGLCFLPILACLVTGRTLELPTRDASDQAGNLN